MPAALKSIGALAVRAALDEFDRIGRSAFLEKYGFGEARQYMVVHPVSGTLADSKAIVGAAHGYEFPQRGPLRPKDFTGGEASVVALLESLGFVTQHRGVSYGLNDQEDQTGTPWSPAEVQLVAADYFQMLALELAGQTYNKATRRRALLPLLNGRTEASIEFKRRNISAVMVNLGYPYLRGYVPASNVQQLLADVVEREVARFAALDKVVSAAVEMPVTDPEEPDFSAVRTAPPQIAVRTSEEPRPGYFRAAKRNYLEQEARNRSLGDAGERFVLQYERWRLAHEGAPELAAAVRHVSVLEGDGLGYDILSFESDGRERYVEVKTTSFGERTPFFISETEVRRARSDPEKYTLLRLYDFRVEPRLFELKGPVERHCYIDPVSYRASLH
jgi:hypothetical protein